MSGERSLNIPPVYFLVALALMGFLHKVFPLAHLLHGPARWVGVVVIVPALALALWAAALFKRADTGIVPFSPATTLVLSGPYRFTRNPMYLGLTGLLLGAALLMGSLSALVVVPAFMALIADRFIRPEEAMLERTFGQPYLDYKARVRRWL